MANDTLLRELTALVRALPQPDAATRFEWLVQSVYGNLALERPELTIERVREVLSRPT